MTAAEAEVVRAAARTADRAARRADMAAAMQAAIVRVRDEPPAPPVLSYDWRPI